MSKRPDLFGILCLVLAVAGWGLNWPALKLLLQEVPPLTGRGYACLAVAGTLFAIARLRGVSLAVPAGEWKRLVPISLLNITAWNGTSVFGLNWLSASEGTIIAYSVPLYAALLAWPVLGEKPTARRLLALAIGIGGIIVLMAGHGLDIGIGKLPGVAIITSGSVLFALGTVLTKRAPLPLAPLPAVMWQVAIGGAPLLLLSWLLESPDWAAMSARSWGFLAYMAIGPLCLCYFAWFAALKRMPASVASIGTLLAPVVGVTAAAVFLGEPLGARELAALAMTLGGVALAIR